MNEQMQEPAGEKQRMRMRKGEREKERGRKGRDISQECYYR